MKAKKLTALCISFAATLSSAALAYPASASAVVSCYYPTVKIDAVSPKVFSVSQSEVDAVTMQRLWQVAEQPPRVATHLFGSVIAADQNWLGECAYPGVGLGTGAGGDKSIWFWVWATNVDIVTAKRSIIDYVSREHVGSSDWSFTAQSATQDVSTVAQPLADDSIVAVTTHRSAQASFLSIKRLGGSGSLLWSVAPSNLMNSEVYASTSTSTGQALFVGAEAGSTHDAFLMKVSAYGLLKKVSIGDLGGDEFPRTVTECADGSVYVGGMKQSGTSSDIFVAYFDSALRSAWATTFGSLGTDDLFSISCGLDNSAKVSMWSSASFLQHGSDSHYNYFLTSLSPNGLVTETVLADADVGNLSPIAGAHAADGSYYVAGELNSSRSVGSCLGGSFVERFSPSGQLMWRSTIDCANLNRKVAVDSQGRVVVAGTAVSRSGSDFLLHVYSPAGEKLSTSQFDVAGEDVMSSLAINSEDRAVLGGYSRDEGANWDVTISALSTAAAANGTTPPTTAAAVATATAESFVTKSMPPVTVTTAAAAPVPVAATTTAAAPPLLASARAVAPNLSTAALPTTKKVKKKKKCKVVKKKVFSKKKKKFVTTKKRVCR